MIQPSLWYLLMAAIQDGWQHDSLSKMTASTQTRILTFFEFSSVQFNILHNNFLYLRGKIPKFSAKHRPETYKVTHTESYLHKCSIIQSTSKRIWHMIVQLPHVTIVARSSHICLNEINKSVIPNQQLFSLVSNFSSVTRIMKLICLTWAVADVGKTKIWVTDASCGVFNGTELDDFSVEST